MDKEPVPPDATQLFWIGFMVLAAVVMMTLMANKLFDLTGILGIS